jgi:hypothetical protein
MYTNCVSDAASFPMQDNFSNCFSFFVVWVTETFPVGQIPIKKKSGSVKVGEQQSHAVGPP